MIPSFWVAQPLKKDYGATTIEDNHSATMIKEEVGQQNQNRILELSYRNNLKPERVKYMILEEKWSNDFNFEALALELEKLYYYRVIW